MVERRGRYTITKKMIRKATHKRAVRNLKRYANEFREMGFTVDVVDGWMIISR